MTQNGQFCLIHNFSNFFPLKWLRMTQNGQFCMAKIKYTLIQGNFYERLLFYLDSCALSPMASLLQKIIINEKNIYRLWDLLVLFLPFMLGVSAFLLSSCELIKGKKPCNYIVVLAYLTW